MEDINNALLHIKAKHNGEIPYQYGSRECAKLMVSYAKEYHECQLKLLRIANVIQSLPNGKQIPSDEVLLDFIDWFGTWQTDKRLGDYGINDILDAYKLNVSEE